MLALGVISPAMLLLLLLREEITPLLEWKGSEIARPNIGILTQSNNVVTQETIVGIPPKFP